MTIEGTQTMAARRMRGPRTSRAASQRHNPVAKIFAYIFFTLLLIFFLLPIVYSVVTAFQPPALSLNPVPQWLFVPTLDNFVALFRDANFLGPVLNSLQVSIGSALLALVISAPAAYALSRARVSSAGIFGFWLLAARALPAIGLAIPAYAIFTQIGLSDSLVSLLIVYLPFNTALATIMLKIYIDAIPYELDESAALDGAGSVRTMVSVILPIARPGIASVTIMTFLFAWNNFLFPLVLSGRSSQTIPMQLQQFLGSYNLEWTQVMAGVVLLSLPLIVLAAFFGRYIVGGLAAGSVK